VPVRGLVAGPNPLQAETRISYNLPRAGFVDCAVYDGTGRRVAELAHGVQAAGAQSLQWNAAGAQPGVYVVRLEGAAAGAVRVVKAE
jgi:hypothetical protein